MERGLNLQTPPWIRHWLSEVKLGKSKTSSYGPPGDGRLRTFN